MSDNPKQQVIRKPGSQVAPNQKPLFKADRQTASTHTRIPVHEATAGKLFRVRDKADAGGNAVVWGDNLSYEDALKLKEKVVGSRRSRTARVEEMEPEEIADASIVDAALEDIGGSDIVDTATQIASNIPAPAIDEAALLSQFEGVPLDAINELSEGELRVWMGLDPKRWAQAFFIKNGAHTHAGGAFDVPFVAGWFANLIDVVKSANQLIAPNDAQLEIAKKKALAAAAPVAAQAQARAVTKPVPVPTAKVAKPKPVVVSDPPKPPPSPLTDEEIEDGPAAEIPPDEVLLDAGEIADISAEVGGGPSDADKAKAREQAAKDATDTTAAAIGAYAAAVKLSDNGPWPTWEQLGEFEHAGWRYYVAHGGEPPALVKEPRKVAHAMGSAS